MGVFTKLAELGWAAAHDSLSARAASAHDCESALKANKENETNADSINNSILMIINP